MMLYLPLSLNFFPVILSSMLAWMMLSAPFLTLMLSLLVDPVWATIMPVYFCPLMSASISISILSPVFFSLPSMVEVTPPLVMTALMFQVMSLPAVGFMYLPSSTLALSDSISNSRLLILAGMMGVPAEPVEVVLTLVCH